MEVKKLTQLRIQMQRTLVHTLRVLGESLNSLISFGLICQVNFGTIPALGIERWISVSIIQKSSYSFQEAEKEAIATKDQAGRIGTEERAT